MSNSQLYVRSCCLYVCLSSFQNDYSARLVLAVFARFGYNVDKLDGAKVYSLYNVFTLAIALRDYFDTLLLWFEATVSSLNYHL